MQQDANALLTDLLEAVSRSFYLTLRLLPSAVRPQIGLAYLLARATDTIADTELIPTDRRLTALSTLRSRIIGQRTEPVDFNDIASAQAPGETAAAERVLLQRIEEAITVLHSMSDDDRARIRSVLDTITSGQELDLQRFGAATAERPVSLSTDAELDDYTYRVAGCVGEFWTKICRAHLFPSAPLNESTLLADGVRFGKGLQLVNILRDLPRDIAQGRCYLPADRLARVGLKPSDLSTPANEARLRPVYEELLDTAHSHLAAGWNYTNALPRSAIRLRLACALPILIGIRTLALLRRQHVLDPAHRVKVTRAEVRKIAIGALLRYPFTARWHSLFATWSR